MPSTTMMTAPSSIPWSCRVRSAKTSTARVKPRKIASPPIRGMGWSCIRRPSLGTSTAPTFCAKDLTTGVATKEMSSAVIRAVATSPRKLNSVKGMGMLLLCISGPQSRPFYRPCAGSCWPHSRPSPPRRGKRTPDTPYPPGCARSPPGWGGTSPPRPRPRRA